MIRRQLRQLYARIHRSWELVREPWGRFTVRLDFDLVLTPLAKSSDKQKTPSDSSERPRYAMAWHEAPRKGPGEIAASALHESEERIVRPEDLRDIERTEREP